MFTTKENRLIHYTNVIPPTSLATGDVTTVEILDGTVVNADVDAAAAIAGTKITAASTTVVGTVELATGAETNTGTDATRAVSPDGLDDWTGSAQITTVGTIASGNADAAVSASSVTVAGKIEVATAAEVNTGTDATRAVSPDGLAGSNLGTKTVQMVVFDFGTATATGDGKFYFHVPASLAGMNIIDVHAEVITAGTTGTTDIQLHNLTAAADILSTKLTIDSGETGSDTAATPAVISATEDDLTENDVIRVDVDAVSTTPANGLIVTFECQLP